MPRFAAPFLLILLLAGCGPESANQASEAPNKADSDVATSASVTPSATPVASPAPGTQFVPEAKIKWRTESEENTFGFIVERAKAEAGPFEKANDKVISGHGTTNVPNSYQFVDRNVEAGETYFYRLWSVTYDGEREMLGVKEHRVKTAEEVK